MRWFLVSSIWRGTTPFIMLGQRELNSGCMAMVQSKICLSSNDGLVAFVWMEKWALARMKSISAQNSYDWRMAGTCGRIYDREICQDTDDFPAFFSFQLPYSIVCFHYFGRFYENCFAGGWPRVQFPWFSVLIPVRQGWRVFRHAW